jgi:hypothetical protein
MARKHAGEGAGEDQVAAVVLVAEHRAIALGGARRGRLVDELEFEADTLAVGLRPSDFIHASRPDTTRRSCSFERGPHSANVSQFAGRDIMATSHVAALASTKQAGVTVKPLKHKHLASTSKGSSQSKTSSMISLCFR